MKNTHRLLVLLLAALMIFTAAAFAQPQLDSITDSIGILSDSEELTLENKAQAVGSEYSFGIYAIIVQDWRSYVSASNIKSAAGKIYDDYELGYGERKDGLLLLLSMNDREYAIITGSSFSERIFNDSSLTRVEDRFLDDFKVNDWAGGLKDYISGAEKELASRYASAVETQGKIDTGAILYAGGRSPAVNLLIVLGIPMLIAAIVCGIFAAGMKNARIATDAGNYLDRHSLHFTIRSDRFTHTTRNVTKIERNNTRSGGGGGHSGHSGHF